jgi:hypothetical protein
MQPADLPSLVTVRDVVYTLAREEYGRDREKFHYVRRSVPPDAKPGKRSAWPVTYRPGLLPPDAQPVDEETAARIQRASLQAYLERAGT